MVCWYGGVETGNLANEEANPINLKAAVDLNAEAWRRKATQRFFNVISVLVLPVPM